MQTLSSPCLLSVTPNRGIRSNALLNVAPAVEHYVDLFADDEPRGGSVKQSSFVTAVELFEKLSDEPSLNENVMEFQVYSEPRCRVFPLFPLGMCHYFIVIETLNWWWSFELRGGSVVIQRGKDFSSVQCRCQGEYRRSALFLNGPLLVRQAAHTHGCVADVVALIQQNGLFHNTAALKNTSSLFFVSMIQDALLPASSLPTGGGSTTVTRSMWGAIKNALLLPM
ncbi:hypothetical protein TRVL_06583 [Trypanosoma vivax]|nr:hypothetical protein TRVL_06583 [Trypanosoma vivax]